MSDEQVTLTINDKSVTVPKGTMVVNAAKKAGIEIPVFCYPEKLGPFGCCRMCLVEVEKMPKLTTACTLAVAPDMVVKTESPKAVKAQKGVLEFTLLNHPLDCPVCDKGGECPLQDNTFKFGPDMTRMEYVRGTQDKATPLSPVITIDRERCIACQRCTRYSDIIEKDQALVMLYRGFDNEVATFNNQPYDTRFSGNVIDICPVGALTDSVFRFQARSWDLDDTGTLCGHCGCNCNMTIGARVNELKRVVTRTNDAVDDGWICDKARFGYEFTKSANRILAPEKKGSGEALSVQEVCGQVADALKKIVDEHGPDSVGFIGSPQGLNEDLYLYQKLFRTVIGTNNIDHKTYADSPGLPVEHYDFLNIETAQLILLIASDPSEELPILDLRIKKAVTRRGAKLVTLNYQKTEMDRFADLSYKYNIGSDHEVLASLADGLAGKLGLETGEKVDRLEERSGISDDEIMALVEVIHAGVKICVIYNPSALTGNSINAMNRLLSVAGKIPETAVGAIPAAPGTNAVGAKDMGVLPDYYPGGVSATDETKVKELWGETAPVKPGLSALDMIRKAAEGDLKALVVHRSNPVADFPQSRLAEKALKNLKLLVVHDMMQTETGKLAHYVIPSNGPGFDEGTTTNIGGRVQLRRKGMNPKNPPDWKVITMIANAMGDETRYTNVADILKEISGKVSGYSEIKMGTIRKEGKNRASVLLNGGSSPGKVPAMEKVSDGSLRLRVADYLFRHDKMLDASSSLAHKMKPSMVCLHASDAEQLGVSNGDQVKVKAGDEEISAEAAVTNRCNPGGVIVPYISDEQGIMKLVISEGAVTRVRVEK